MSSPPTDLILFGATGDLALRKLFPALYEGAEDPAGPLANVQIMGAARHDLDDAGFRAWLDEHRPDVTVEVHRGGQPLYPYLFGVE